MKHLHRIRQCSFRLLLQGAKAALSLYFFLIIAGIAICPPMTSWWVTERSFSGSSVILISSFLMVICSREACRGLSIRETSISLSLSKRPNISASCHWYRASSSVVRFRRASLATCLTWSCVGIIQSYTKDIVFIISIFHFAASSMTENTPNTSSSTLPSPTDPQLDLYLQQDPIYQNMLRTLDLQRIRMKLSLRYILLMFALFVVFAWIVNNRVIMVGFSDFVWLARIRDALFALMSGLFSFTLWLGSTAWFYHPFLIMFFRWCAVVFFLLILSALYFPIF